MLVLGKRSEARERSVSEGMVLRSGWESGVGGVDAGFEGRLRGVLVMIWGLDL